MKNQNNNTFFYIIRLLILYIIGVSLCYALFSVLHYRIQVTTIAYINFIMLIVVVLLYFNKYSFIGSLAIVFIFLSKFILTKESEGINLNTYLGEFIDAIIVSFETRKFSYDFQYITVILISFALTNTLYLLDFKFKKFTPLVVIIPGIALYVAPYVFLDIDNYIGFVLFCITSISYLFIHQYKNLSYKKTSQYLLFFCGITIFSLLTMYISIFMQENYKPSMIWVKGVIEQVKEISLFKSNKGHERTVLYRSDSDLDGVINKDQTIVLEVYSTKPKYIKSNTFYIYKDNSWQDDLGGGNIMFLDTVQDISIAQNTLGIDILNQLSLGKPVGELDFKRTPSEDLPFTEETIDIEFVNIISNNLFLPYNFTNISVTNTPSEEISYYMSDSSSIFSDSSLEQGYSYSVTTLTPNIESLQFHNFLRESYTGLDIDLINLQQGIIEYEPDPVASSVNTKAIPDNITDRTKELAYEITKNYNTNYDKVRAIEKYLATNYTYNLEVEPLPDGSEYVDYFLFESKEGYCTYFATSMVVLTRAIGMPSRYSVGYKLPQRLTEDLPFMDIELMGDPNQYTVREENAHAWVEVYFEGYGWVQFEPTAPFFRQYANSLPINYDDYEIVTQPEEDNQVNETGTLDGIDFRRIINTMLFILLIIIPITFVIYRKARYFFKSEKQKVVYSYKRILILYRLLGYKRLGNETAATFSHRVYDKLAAFDESFLDVTEIFEKARYSKSDMTKTDVSTTTEYLSFLKVKLWEQSIIKYLYYRVTS